MSGHYVKRQTRIQETNSYTNVGVKSNTDFVCKLLPEFLDTQTKELSQTDFCTSFYLDDIKEKLF